MRLGGAGEEMTAGTASRVQPAGLKLGAPQCPAGAAVVCWKDPSPAPFQGAQQRRHLGLPDTARSSCHPDGPDQATRTRGGGTMMLGPVSMQIHQNVFFHKGTVTILRTGL